MEGLALWYLHELGLADGRADELASRLVGWQWPDGGWNCDKNPAARTSSVQETLLPLRGLARHVQAGRAAPALNDAIDRAAEFLLQRRLLWRRRDGAPIRPAWGRDPLLIQWPIRFYDVLSALTVMTELERVRDPRCADALHHLAGKRLSGGGFPVEVRTARTVGAVASDGTFANWGPSGRRRPNPFVTIDATWVLRAGLGSQWRLRRRGSHCVGVAGGFDPVVRSRRCAGLRQAAAICGSCLPPGHASGAPGRIATSWPAGAS